MQPRVCQIVLIYADWAIYVREFSVQIIVVTDATFVMLITHVVTGCLLMIHGEA